jgi:AraC-like DNA-binding protein
MSVTEVVDEPYDSVELSRLVLGVTADAGADARALARDAGFPRWLLGSDQAMIASRRHGRLWELAEHALQDPCAGLTAVAHHRVGDLALFDYLFTTAATVREGLQVTADFFHLVSTNCSLRLETRTDRDATFSYRHALPGGRGEELWTQFSIAGFCARIRAATGRPVIPAHVSFAQAPPRSRRRFIETFGTGAIDFGAPVTTFTLRDADLDLPMPGADPVLAGILRRYAETMPRPRPADWLSQFREALAEALDDREPSLNTAARRLAVSVRTLQRRLAEHGTTWRAELETARQHRARQMLQDGTPGTARLARHLGYSAPRSLRRAVQRWNGNG